MPHTTTARQPQYIASCDSATVEAKGGAQVNKDTSDPTRRCRSEVDAPRVTLTRQTLWYPATLPSGYRTRRTLHTSTQIPRQGLRARMPREGPAMRWRRGPWGGATGRLRFGRSGLRPHPLRGTGGGWGADGGGYPLCRSPAGAGSGAGSGAGI